MSEAYLPYHRRFRPKNITEYVGNDHIKKSVMNMLRDKQRPQVLLFEGHAGCGKTSMARITAREYLCESRSDISGACGECYNCKMLDEYIESGDSGGLMNLREVDIADANKRQDIDNILEEAAVPTYDGSWRVYILDEFHMATKQAQNRLLKIAEEPPEKVLIVLCTTNPEDIIPTIISRCQYTFHVKKPNRDELSSLLAKVCRKEGFEFEPKALSLICAKGDFVPRQALISLEKVTRESDKVSYKATLEILNMVADKLFFDFFKILVKEQIDIGEYVSFIGNVKKDMDLKQFVENLLSFTMRGIYINHGVMVDALDSSEISQYKKIFSEFSTIDLTNLLDLILNMKTSVDVEAKLLLLGYSGIKRKSYGFVEGSDSDLGYLTDAYKHTPAQEKASGDENRKKAITMTEEEQVAIINAQKEVVDTSDIVRLLGGSKVFL